MSEENPHVIVIAGPNGAGKSTTAPMLLKGTLGVTEFVNADVIAQGLSAFQPESAAFHAGRVMLERLHYLAKERVDFAFETTVASRSFAPWIAKLKQSGYTFHLVFLWLPSADFAVARVAERVRMGGHDVPEETIRRRYKKVSGTSSGYTGRCRIPGGCTIIRSAQGRELWLMAGRIKAKQSTILKHGE